jgi:drug/metabolite transporter (DMT)-like permease
VTGESVTVSAVAEPRAALDRRRGSLFVLLAAMAWSTAGLLQRELSVGTGTQLAGRAIFAVITLLAFVAVAERGRVVRSFRAIGWHGVAVACSMAVASGAFFAALNRAPVANVLFMQALAPMMAAGLGIVMLRESLRARTVVAMAAAVVGVAVMLGGPGRPSLVGELLAFLSACGFALALVLTRRRHDISMAPATCLSQFLVFAVSAPFSHPGEVGGRDLVMLVLLGSCQIGLGLMLLTVGARLIPAAEVALISLLEIVLGPLWVWIALSERPSGATLAGGAVVLGAVAIHTVADLSPQLQAGTSASNPATPPPP